jgi:hypothetical protein
MKAAVAVLVGLAILATGFGAYRLLGDDEERVRAESAAEELVAFCKQSGTPCDVLKVDRASGERWLLHVRDSVGGKRCLELDVEQFRASTSDSIYVGGSVDGVTDAPCGPEWWRPDEAERRLAASNWARKHRATLVSCTGTGGSPGRSWYFRRFRCRYSHSHGDHVVLLVTRGQDTFEIGGR